MKDDLLMLLPFALLFALWFPLWELMRRRQHPPTPDQMEAARLLGDPKWLPSGWAGLAFAAVYLAAHGARSAMPGHEPARVAALVVVAAAFAVFMGLFVREVRQGDEVARQVRLDALTSTFATFLCFAVGMWLMGEIWPSPRRGRIELALVFLPLFYFVGLFGAKGRLMPAARSHRG
jgi:MFS family permease